MPPGQPIWYEHMSSWHEFLTMGGYAVYVWPAYGIATAVLVVNVILPGRRLKRLRAEIRRRGNGAGP